MPIKLEASSRSAIIRFESREHAEKAVYALKGVPVTTGNGARKYLGVRIAKEPNTRPGQRMQNFSHGGKGQQKGGWGNQGGHHNQQQNQWNQQQEAPPMAPQTNTLPMIQANANPGFSAAPVGGPVAATQIGFSNAAPTKKKKSKKNDDSSSSSSSGSESDSSSDEDTPRVSHKNVAGALPSLPGDQMQMTMQNGLTATPPGLETPEKKKRRTSAEKISPQQLKKNIMADIDELGGPPLKRSKSLIEDAHLPITRSDSMDLGPMRMTRANSVSTQVANQLDALSMARDAALAAEAPAMPDGKQLSRKRSNAMMRGMTMPSLGEEGPATNTTPVQRAQSGGVSTSSPGRRANNSQYLLQQIDEPTAKLWGESCSLQFSEPPTGDNRLTCVLKINMGSFVSRWAPVRNVKEGEDVNCFSSQDMRLWCAWMSAQISSQNNEFCQKHGIQQVSSCKLREAHLDFSDNGIADDCLMLLINWFIQKRVRVRVLKLCGNRLTDGGVKSILDHMVRQEDKPYHELSLSRNKFSASALKELLDAINQHPAYPRLVCIENSTDVRHMPLQLHVDGCGMPENDLTSMLQVCQNMTPPVRVR